MNALEELLQEAVSRFTKRSIKAGFQQEALHEYKDLEGKNLYWRIRLKHPESGKKWIRPIRWIDGEGYSLSEPEFPEKKPLYNLHRFADQPEAVIWVVEGEWSSYARIWCMEK